MVYIDMYCIIIKHVVCPIVVVIATTVIGLIVARYKLINGWLNHQHQLGFWQQLSLTNEEDLKEIEPLMAKHRVNPNELSTSKWRYHRGWILWYSIKTFYK